MTRKLEEIFNVDPADVNDQDDDQSEEIEEVQEDSQEVTEPDMNDYGAWLDAVDKIDAALPMVKNLETNEQEMDDLAAKSIETYEQLIDLGMNVEQRFSGRLFEVAATMMGHAITAKNAKTLNKLKVLEMQLKKAKFDSENKEQGQSDANSEGTVMSRNDLVKALIEESKKSEDREN